MSIAPHKTHSRGDPSPAYKDALARVGGQPSRIENMARWILNFSFKPTESFSHKDWKDLQWEGAAFFYGEEFPRRKPQKAKNATVQKVAAALVAQKYPWTLGFEIDPLPSKGDLAELQNWLRSLWHDLQQDGAVWITTSGWVAQLSVKNDGALVGVSSPQASSWSQRFKYRAYGVLTATDVVNRIRFCKNEKCRRPFLSIKRQAFCSPSCSQRHRTSLFRAKNREKFRAQRREYYKKKQRERTGSPNLRIQTKKGVRR